MGNTTYTNGGHLKKRYSQFLYCKGFHRNLPFSLHITKTQTTYADIRYRSKKLSSFTRSTQRAMERKQNIYSFAARYST